MLAVTINIIMFQRLFLLIEAIRFKVEQRMEGARKDRHVTQNTMPQFVAQ